MSVSLQQCQNNGFPGLGFFYPPACTPREPLDEVLSFFNELKAVMVNAFTPIDRPGGLFRRIHCLSYEGKGASGQATCEVTCNEGKGQLRDPYVGHYIEEKVDCEGGVQLEASTDLISGIFRQYVKFGDDGAEYKIFLDAPENFRFKMQKRGSGETAFQDTSGRDLKDVQRQLALVYGTAVKRVLRTIELQCKERPEEDDRHVFFSQENQNHTSLTPHFTDIF